MMEPRERGYEHAVQYMGKGGAARLQERIDLFAISPGQVDHITRQIGEFADVAVCLDALTTIVLDGLQIRHKREARTVEFLRQQSPDRVSQYFRYAGDPNNVGRYMDVFHQLASGAMANVRGAIGKGPSVEIGSVMMLGDVGYDRVLRESVQKGLEYLKVSGYQVENLDDPMVEPARSALYPVYNPLTGEPLPGLLHLIHERGLVNILKLSPDISPDDAVDHLVNRSNSLVLVNGLPKSVRDKVSRAQDKDKLNGPDGIAWAVGNIYRAVHDHPDPDRQHGIVFGDEVIYDRRVAA